MKRQLARRQRAVPICQRKLALVPLQLVNPVWVHDDAVDFNRHVQRFTLPPQHAGAAGRRRCPPEFRPAGPPPSVVAPVRHRRPAQRPVGLLHTGAPHCAGRTGRCVAGAGAVRRDPEASGNAAPRPRAMAPPGPGLATATLKHDAAQHIKLLRHSPDVVSARWPAGWPRPVAPELRLRPENTAERADHRPAWACRHGDPAANARGPGRAASASCRPTTRPSSHPGCCTAWPA